MLENLIKNWYFGFVIEFRLYIYIIKFITILKEVRRQFQYIISFQHIFILLFSRFFLFNVTIRSPYYITFSRLNDLD